MALRIFPILFILAPILILAALGLIYLARMPIVESLRYDAISRSPINTLLISSLANLPATRADRKEAWLRHRFEDELVEFNGKASFSYYCFSRWFSLQIELLSLIFIYGCLLASFLVPSKAHSASTLAITSVLQLLNILHLCVRLVV